jgi:hypothetical protein
MYESDIGIEEQLMPVRFESVCETDGKIPPKITRSNRVVTAKGRAITIDLPAPWCRFIEYAMNWYFDSEQYAGDPLDKLGKVVAHFLIEGDPRVKEDSRIVSVTDEGKMSLDKKKDYSNWVSKAKKHMRRNWKKRPKEMPLTGRYQVVCTYHVRPRKDPRTLPDYCAATLDCLKEMGIFAKINSSVVYSIDGSKVVPELSYDPYTEVKIREYVAKEVEK